MQKIQHEVDVRFATIHMWFPPRLRYSARFTLSRLGG